MARELDGEMPPESLRPHFPARIGQARSGRYGAVVPFLLLLVQAGLIAGLAWQSSINRTETGHVGAAIYLYRTGRFDVFAVNPPLTRAIVGGAIALSSSEYHWKSCSLRSQPRPEWTIGSYFVKANSPTRIRWIIFYARCSLIPIVLIGGYFGFRFAAQLYGYYAGVVFLLLWTFSPTILAWGSTVCPDVAAAALGITGVYWLRCWLRCWLRGPTWENATIAGVCLGLLPLAKLTWIIAFPLWIVIWLMWIIPHRTSTEKGGERLTVPRLRQFLLILLLAVFVVNLGYGSDGTFRPLMEFDFASETLSGAREREGTRVNATGNRFRDSWLGYVPMPLPADMIQGIDIQRHDFERGLPCYLAGTLADRGWWYYYIYALLVKMPLGIWGLLFLAVLSTFLLKGFACE